MYRTRALTLFAVFATAVPTAAQLNVTATSGPFSTIAGGQQAASVTPGLNISAGISIASTAITGRSAAATAELVRTVSQPTRELIEIIARASVGFQTQPPYTVSSADANVDVSLSLTSAVPLPVTIQMEMPWDHSACEVVSSTVTVDGTALPRCSVFPSCTTTIDTIIGAVGVQIDVTCSAHAVGSTIGRCVFGSSGYANVRIDVRPRTAIGSYGGSCGATLSANQGDLQDPRLRVQLDDPSLPLFGVLLIGTQQVTLPLPIGSCSLLTNAVASAPLAIDANGSAAFTALPPPPGLLTIQGVMFSGTTLHASNGVQL